MSFVVVLSQADLSWAEKCRARSQTHEIVKTSFSFLFFDFVVVVDVVEVIGVSQLMLGNFPHKCKFASTQAISFTITCFHNELKFYKFITHEKRHQLLIYFSKILFQLQLAQVVCLKVCVEHSCHVFRSHATKAYKWLWKDCGMMDWIWALLKDVEGKEASRRVGVAIKSHLELSQLKSTSSSSKVVASQRSTEIYCTKIDYELTLILTQMIHNSTGFGWFHEWRNKSTVTLSFMGECRVA